jgi:phage baseplate assembly protein V
VFTMDDFNRMTAKIKTKIFLLVGRAVLAAIKNTEKTQKIQVVALAGETISDIERFQEYGLETLPEKDAEVLITFVNGNRDQGVAVCVHDRRYRPKSLASGEVMLYTKENDETDPTTKFQILMKTGREIDLIAEIIKMVMQKDLTITAESIASTTTKDTKFTAKTAEVVTTDGAQIQCDSGKTVLLGQASGQKTLCLSDLVDSINNIISSLNSHQHPETGGVTGAPVVPLVALVKANLVTKETQAT